jgi:ABC-type transport system involved in multi-copper enzyme maturation permease subunit
MTPLLVIARFTWLETLRSRFFWLALGLIALCSLCSLFLAQLAIFEISQFQTGILGGLLRLVAVLLMSLLSVASLVREGNDRTLALMLSRAVTRRQYVLGKFLGFALPGLLLALACGFTVLPFSSATPTAIWTVSLLLELFVLLSASLFFTLAIGQFVGSMALLCCFYLLARSLSAMRILAHHPLSDNALSGSISSLVLDSLAYLLPPLDRLTQSAWLAYGGAGGDMQLSLTSADNLLGLAQLGLQCLLFSVLLLSATLFDFYRRELQ